MFQPRLAILAVCGALTIPLASPAKAQTTGKISGTVRVLNGEAIVGATVTATNQQTGAKQSAVSTAGGAYEVANLPPGAYTVSADVQGFRGVVVNDQKVEAGGTHTLNIVLQAKFSEAVTVSAMKRAETIQETPVSVTAQTEETIRDRGIQNIEDVAVNTAGFTVQNLGPGQSTVALRGVSSGQIARDQPGVKEQVGAYLDESAISLSLFTPDLDLFDMNRVEVLRGPQGTLFGSGSVGGTVRYISNQPQLGVNSAFGEIGGNSVNGGGTGGAFKAGFNAGLGSTAALRVAAYYNRLAGWMDAVEPNLSARAKTSPDYSLVKNVNSGDREGARVALEFAPVEGLTVTPRFVYQKVAMEGWNRVDEFNILANPFTTTRPPVTLGGTKQFIQLDEPFTDKFLLGDLNIKYDFGAATLTSITSVSNRDILVVRDATALTGSVTGGTIGEPESVYTLDAPLYDQTRANGWTQELRLSNDKGRLKWVGGFFYSDSQRRYDQNLPVKGFQVADVIGIPTKGDYAPTDDLYFSDILYKSKEYGIFGEATFAVTNQFSLTAGLRYYHYKVDKDLIFDGLFAPDYPHFTPGNGTTKADGVAPRFIASYKLSDSLTLNAQASKGFRLGGINDPLLKPLCSPDDLAAFGDQPNWKDETAWNYEVGAKTTFMGGRGSVNGSVYYVDVKDLQVVYTVGTCSSRIILNAPKARSVGGELEVTLAPTENFDFSASASYSDATVRTSFNGTEAQIKDTGIREGNRLPSVAKFQAALAATYQQHVGANSTGYVTATYQHVGSRYTQMGDQEPGVGVIPIEAGVPGALGHTIGGPLTQSTFTFNPLLPAYDTVNARVGVRHGIWDVAFYVNNITDEQALLAIDRERGFRARLGFLTNQPRTFGINSRVDF